MTMRPDDDQDLREAFAAARRTETASTPSFERVRRGRLTQLPYRPRRWPWAAAWVAAAVVVAIVAKRRAEEPPAWLETIGQLRSSTDFLLDVNGAEFLRTVPSIGRTEGWFPVSGVSEGQRL
jgi:hypothetical protein